MSGRRERRPGSASAEAPRPAGARARVRFVRPEDLATTHPLFVAAAEIEAGRPVPEELRPLVVDVLLAEDRKRTAPKPSRGRKRDERKRWELRLLVDERIAAGLGKVQAVERVAEAVGIDARQVWRLIGDAPA